MSCQSVQRVISAYLDGRLAGEDSSGVRRHLSRCRECETRWEQTRHLRALLRGMPAAVPPPQMAVRLRVMASHERLRRLSRISFSARIRNWADRLQLSVNDLMRPLALPFAGGVFSSLLLFSMLVPTLLFQFNFHNNDVPTALYTEASLNEILPFALNYDGDIEVTINERGEVADYSLPSGADHKLETSIANILFFSNFKPATLFGRPTSSKLGLSFRRSHIIVRG